MPFVCYTVALLDSEICFASCLFFVSDFVSFNTRRSDSCVDCLGVGGEFCQELCHQRIPSTPCYMYVD